MPQVVTCGGCGVTIPLPDEYISQYAGQQTRCQGCGAPYVIPAPAAAMPPSPPQAPYGQGGVLQYAAPVSPAFMGACWSSGNRLVMLNDAATPDRCIKCNAPANGYCWSKKLYWHHPALSLLAIVGLLPYALVAMCVRQSAFVRIALCPVHRRKRRWAILGLIVTIFGGIAMMGGGIDLLSLPQSNHVLGGVVLALSFVVFIGGLVMLMRFNPVRPRKMENGYVWLSGANQTFLETLPGVVGPR
jgi:hypothetical protein